MIKISFTSPDESMPRSVFYDRLRESLQRQPSFVQNEAEANVLIPAEDVAIEYNWPRYGNLPSAMTRGEFDQAKYEAYLNRLAAVQQPVLIVNMHPSFRLPQIFRQHANIILADGSLAGFERSLNPRTISMPALPIQTGDGQPAERTVLASFRGIASHPVRLELQKLHNGQSIICELVEPTYHGTLDATAARQDSAYTDLLRRSVFAFVPRGDSLFSYRLLEVMSFGCIPIILSDGWVLPFDRTVRWANVSLTIPEAAVGVIPQMLQLFTPERVAEMTQAVREVYQAHFSSLDAIVTTMLGEL